MISPGAEPVRTERGGWTLIEIVVVLALLVALATLVLAVSPRLLEQAKAARGAGPVHQIQGVRGNTALDLVIPAPQPGTPTWRVFRQPRLLVGEHPLPLPLDVAVDLNPGRSQGVPVRNVPPPPGSNQQPTAFW